MLVKQVLEPYYEIINGHTFYINNLNNMMILKGIKWTQFIIHKYPVLLTDAVLNMEMDNLIQIIDDNIDSIFHHSLCECDNCQVYDKYKLRDIIILIHPSLIDIMDTFHYRQNRLEYQLKKVIKKRAQYS